MSESYAKDACSASVDLTTTTVPTVIVVPLTDRTKEAAQLAGWPYWASPDALLPITTRNLSADASQLIVPHLELFVTTVTLVPNVKLDPSLVKASANIPPEAAYKATPTADVLLHAIPNGSSIVLWTLILLLELTLFPVEPDIVPIFISPALLSLAFFQKYKTR